MPPFAVRLSGIRLLCLALAAAALQLTAPGWADQVSRAQQSCASDNPPCPTPPPLTVGVQAIVDTVRTNPVTVYFNVLGLGSGSKSVSVLLDGVAVGTPTWTYDPNGTSGSGSALVTLGNGSQSVTNHTVTIKFCETGRTPDCSSDATTATYAAPLSPPFRGYPTVLQETGIASRRSLSGCAGCGDATLSYSTPAYHSRDQARSLTLLYSSAASAPLGLVVLDINANSSEAPDRISVSLLRPNGDPIMLTNGQNEMVYAGGSGTSRISAQYDAASDGTHYYTLTAVVRNWWGSAWLETRTAVKVVILNERYSALGSEGFGQGWMVAGLQHLRTPFGDFGEAMLVEDGRAVVFANCGPACWTAPAGEGSTFVWQNGLPSRTYADGSVVEFDNVSGQQVVWRDRVGRTTRYAYYADRRLKQITDPAGIVTTITWSGPPTDARTASITTTAPGGRTTVVSINAAGELTSIVDPDNVTALTVGYANHRIVTATGRNGGTTNFTYDAYGSLASIVGPAVDVQGIGMLRSTTTIRSRELALLPAPGLGSQTNPAARVLPQSVWMQVTNPRGGGVMIRTNGPGDPTMMITTDAAGKTDSTTIEYGFDNHPRTVWSSSGVRMEYTWDRELLKSVTDNVAMVTTSYDYNGYGQLSAMRVNQVTQLTNTYSAAPQSLLETSTQGDAISRFTYDALGRVLTATDGGGHQATYSYEPSALQNLANVTVNGRRTDFGYDAFGRRTTTTNAAGQVSTVNYDLLNRPQFAVVPGRGTSSWSYNDPGRTYSFIDGKSQQYTTTLNALGATVTETNPYNLNVSDRYGYDSDGNLSSLATRGGRSVQIQRDLLGRPTKVTAGSDVTNISYDPARKWTAYANTESIDTLFVDGAGRVTKQSTFRTGGPSQNPGLMRFEMRTSFGAVGEKRKLTVTSPLWASGDSAEFGVDALLRPNYVGTFDGSWTSITYNTDHRPQTIKFPQVGATRRLQSFSYTGSDRLASSTSNVAPEVLSWSYGYDVLNRASQLTQGEGTYAASRMAGYDAAGRLAQWTDYRTVDLPPQWVCDDPGSTELTNCYWYYGTQTQAVRDSTYSYDLVGNRTDLGASVQPGNRLTYFNGYTMNYDADGNLLSKTGNGVSQSFSWNALGQLASVTSNGVTTSYGYDGLGRRVRKTVNGVTQKFLYDGDNLVMKLSAEGIRQLEFSYYPGVDNPHSVRESATGNIYYYATSQPGNVIALVNRFNQVVNRYEYTPFGQEISKTEQVVQPFQFAGRELDSETGLYYNRARYYDPSVARFISEDPIGLAGGVNQYAYAESDPLNAADPYGLAPCTDQQLGGGAIQATFSDGNVVCKEGTGLPPIVTTAPRTPPSGFPNNFGQRGTPGGYGPGSGNSGPAVKDSPAKPFISSTCAIAAAQFGVGLGLDVYTAVAAFGAVGYAAEAGSMYLKSFAPSAVRTLGRTFAYVQQKGLITAAGANMITANDAYFGDSGMLSQWAAGANSPNAGDTSGWSWIPFYGARSRWQTSYAACG